MTFNASTRSLTGKFTRKATVITNDAEHRNEQLVCTGSVLVPFKTTPRIADFGQLSRTAGPQHKTIKIQRGDGGPLTPELVPVRHQNITANLREVEPGELYELDVELTPPWPNRPLITNLTLKTGVDEAPQETIRVNARIVARLRASPSRFSIPRNTTTDTERKVRLVWSDGKPGKILEAAVSVPEMSVVVEEEKNQQVVVLKVPPGFDPPDNLHATVTLKTDDPEVPALPIQIFVPPPRPRVQAMPGWFSVPQKIDREIDLRTRLVWSGAPGKVLDATTSDPATSVRVEEANNRQYVVLHVPAGYEPVNTSAAVTITTDDPKVPTLRLPVRTGSMARGLRPVERPGLRQAQPPEKDEAPAEPAKPVTPEP